MADDKQKAQAEQQKKNSGTFYAWTKFKKEVNEWGQVTEWVNVGDVVSQGDLDVSDDDWNDLIETGAVREEEYPDIPADQSPAEYYATNPEEAPTPEDEGVTTETPSEIAMPKTENPAGTTQPPRQQS